MKQVILDMYPVGGTPTTASGFETGVGLSSPMDRKSCRKVFTLFAVAVFLVRMLYCILNGQVHNV